MVHYLYGQVMVHYLYDFSLSPQIILGAYENHVAHAGEMNPTFPVSGQSPV